MSEFIGSRATIDLQAVRDNYRTICGVAGSNTVAAAVVKSDAYGLGAARISKALFEEGCRDFWVAYLDEAIELRKTIPAEANIYYLQGFRSSDLAVIKEQDITPVINSLHEYKAISGSNANFVLHVDTGLSRLGMRPEEVDQIIDGIAREKIEYVISHLACSTEKSNEWNLKQTAIFDKTLVKIRSKIAVKAGISATGGTLAGVRLRYDMVRIGAFLYGIQTNEAIKPKNVLTLETPVLQKYQLPAGQSVGYGATYTTTRNTKIAIVSIGYADGLKRSLSNRGLIGFYAGGKFYKAPIIGSISMDLTACDVTDIPDEITNPGSVAIVLSDGYSINDMALDAETIAYEILTSINTLSRRITVEYTEQGE